nr:G protein-coupled receptor [Proales similis]
MDFWMERAFALFYVLNLLVSIGGNGLTVVAILARKELRQSPPFVLIANLVISELAYSLVTMPLVALKLWTGRSPVQDSDILCRLNGSLLIVTGMAVVLFLHLIGANRFIFLLKPNAYKKLFTLGRTCFIAGLVWSVGILMTLSQFTRMARIEFDEKAGLCRNPRAAQAYKVVASIVAVWIPALATTVIYARLIYATRQLKANLRSHGGPDLRLEALRFVEVLFLSWLLVFALSLPILILFICEFDVDKLVVQSLLVLSTLHLSLNWALLVIGSHRLKNSMRTLLFGPPQYSHTPSQNSQDQRILQAIRLLSDDY